MALFKKGKGGVKAAGGKVLKKKKQGYNNMQSSQQQPMMQHEQYDGMITPRNDQQNMERVEEDNEEDVAGQDE